MISAGNDLLNKPIDVQVDTDSAPILLQNLISLSPIVQHHSRKVSSVLDLLVSTGGLAITAFFLLAIFHFYIEDKLFTMVLA